MDEVLSVLKRARERLAKSGAWTRGAYSRDANGCAGLARFELSAVCWCAIGAARAEVFAHDASERIVSEYAVTGALSDTLHARGYQGPLYCFNDEQASVEPILALYDETIARLESEQKP